LNRCRKEAQSFVRVAPSWWNVTGCDGAEMRLDRVSEYARLAHYHEISNLHCSIGRGEVDVRHADTDAAWMKPASDSCSGTTDRLQLPILHPLPLLSSGVRPRIVQDNVL
jgi:hypothetical protein